ncbi:MAG TPA: response regulator, partial [Planctomycetaceae bacterium]
REAEQARQNLRFFVARVNHDIRNPLAILHGYADELRRMDVIRDNDLARRFVDSVRSAAALIELQVNDLDVATRLGDRDLLHEDFKIDRKRIDLRELIGGTVELMQKRATKNGDELVAVLDRRIERGEVPFVSDERRFRQILMNLLSNACKFTQQGRITVRAHVVAKSGEDWLQVEVEDTGRGMTPQQVEGLFKPFRCATAAEGNESGTGLGLCICRNLASRLGGALELRRTAPGRGTVFLLELPLVAPVSSPDGREEEAIPRQEAAALSEVKNVEGDGRAPRELLGRGRSVLVIDDEREILELIRDHLERRGFMVWTAATAEQALRLVREYRPDAITLDVLLPGSRMSGWDVLTKLKSDPETAGIPVVMVTITEDRSRGFALGAADFVSKPVDPDRLVETVLAVCGSSAPGRLLVVEDDAEQRQAIADRLRREGWEVDEAADGLDGFKAAQRHTPEVILLDIIMPKWDGFDLAERLGREPTLRDVPIVVLTGKNLTRQEIERLNTRVQTILQKGSSGIDAALDEMLRRIVKTRREHPTPVAAGGER